MTSTTVRLSGAVLAGVLFGAAGCAGQAPVDDDAVGQAAQADSLSDDTTYSWDLEGFKPNGKPQTIQVTANGGQELACGATTSTLRMSVGDITIDPSTPTQMEASPYITLGFGNNPCNDVILETILSADDTSVTSGSTASVDFTWTGESPPATMAMTFGISNGTYTLALSDLGVDFDGSWTSFSDTGTEVIASTAIATDVAIAGTAVSGATVTGTYTYTDASLTESGSTYQWYRSGTAVSGATSTSYAVTSADVNASLTFCVTPSNGVKAGYQVCSSAVTVPGVVWYTGVSWTGSSVSEVTTNGACVTMSSIGMAGLANSLTLYGVGSEPTIDMYETTDCSGTVWSRSSGADDDHNINLGTVGIGSAIASYKVTW